MATVFTDSLFYADIAAAIREKNPAAGKLRPAEMAAAIKAIPQEVPQPTGVVTDGLVMRLTSMLPAAENKWVDTIQGVSFNLTSCTIESDGVVFNGNSSVGTAERVISLNNSGHVDIIYTPYDVRNCVLLAGARSVDSQTNTSHQFSVGYYGDQLCICDDGNKTSFNVPSSLRQPNKAHSINASREYALFDGLVCSMGYGEYWGANRDVISIGNRVTFSSQPFLGKLHEIRVYSRKLTTHEMSINAKYDQKYLRR